MTYSVPTLDLVALTCSNSPISVGERNPPTDAHLSDKPIGELMSAMDHCPSARHAQASDHRFSPMTVWQRAVTCHEIVVCAPVPTALRRHLDAPYLGPNSCQSRKIQGQ